jgi:hypothetical protein
MTFPQNTRFNLLNWPFIFSEIYGLRLLRWSRRFGLAWQVRRRRKRISTAREGWTEKAPVGMFRAVSSRFRG